MNWYKFKIELVAVAADTVLLTLSALVLLTFSVDPSEMSTAHPLWMRPAVEHREVVFLGFSTAIGLLWLCRWQALKICRGRKAYGTH